MTEIRRSKRIILLLLTLAVIAGLSASRPTLAQDEPADPAPSPTPVDRRFGAIESFWAPQEAAELGVGWERILFYWNEIQPKDSDDWNTLHVLEEWLIEAQSQDRIVLGLLKNTPAWATDGDPFSGLPRGLYLPIDDPENLWANYVRRIVEYYGPRGVHNWIIWNEPEIEAGVYGHEFDGTVEDYARLLQVAYLVAKEHDPQAVIHLAGYSYWHDQEYLGTLLETLASMPDAEESDYYFDVLSLHIYFRVETVGELVRHTDDLQNSLGMDKPIWVNETNAAPNLDPWWPVERPVFQVDLDQQAWYMVQAFALGYAAGADSIGVYKLIDILLPEGGESFGILRPDYSRRPAYQAYATTIRLLAGFSGPVELQETEDYFITTFRNEERLIRVLWARKDQALELSIPAAGDHGKLVDVTGKSRPIAARNEQYRITLGGARCRDQCDIGGPPLFLVEEIMDGFTQDLTVQSTAVRATLTATPQISPTYTPWPTTTSTPTATPTNTATYTPTPTATATDTVTATAAPTQTAVPVRIEQSPAEPTSTAMLTSTPIPVVEGSDPSPPTTGASVANSFWFLGVAGVVAIALIMLLLRGRN